MEEDFSLFLWILKIEGKKGRDDCKKNYGMEMIVKREFSKKTKETS